MRNKPFRLTVGAAALMLVCAAFGQGSLSGVSARPVGEGVVVSIKGTDLGQPKALRVSGNRSYILEFDAKLDGKASRLNINKGGLRYVNVGWYKTKPPKVRVHMRMNPKDKPVLTPTEDGWAVALNVKEAASTPTQTAKASQPFPDKLPPINVAKPNTQLMTMSEPSHGGAATNVARVSLDFVNTDIVQVLKALALQANVNIVTAPEVTGKVSVTLDSVTVQEALDIVTALGGVRYAKVGQTFVVTSNSRFTDTISQMHGKADLNSETRVVPIYSGEGKQIKAAVLRSVPPTTVDGRYELVLPSDKVSVEQSANLQPQSGADDKGSQGADTKMQTKTDDSVNKRDDYVVLVGTPGRLNDIERVIRDVDSKICNAMGVKVPISNGMVQRNYEPQGVDAEELLRVLKADPSLNFGNVQLIATPKTSMSRQVIVLSGRSNEVDRVMSILQNLDSPTDNGPRVYEVVGLKYITPQNALVELTKAVNGLRVSLLPPPIDPSVGVSYDAKAKEGNGNGGSGSPDQGEKGGSTGSQGGSDSKGSNAEGQKTVTAETKSNSIPMKLMLQGTKEQIDRARRHLALIDLAPKQVAIELRVMELTKEEAEKIGLDWSLLTGGTLGALRLNQGLGSPSQAGGVGGRVDFPAGGSLSVTGTLDKLATNGKLLSRPNILASDGQLSTIFVGDEIRYIETIIATSQNTTITTGKVNVGVNLSVIPRIGDDGNIAIDLAPEFSILRGFTEVPGGGQLPQISTRRAESIFNLKSGETVAIGGLIQDQDRRSDGGIPILKDLPIIGRLFRRTDTQKIRTEVVFFLTVKDVTNNHASAANPRQSERENTSLPGNKPPTP